MNKVYESRYGRLEVESVSPLMRVRDIKGADFPDDIKFDLETAEKIVLITDNRRSQIGFQVLTGGRTCYLIVHESASHGYVVKIVSLEYRGQNPQKEIESLALRCINL